MADWHIQTLLDSSQKIGLKLANQQELYLLANQVIIKNISAIGGDMAIRILLTAGHDTMAINSTNQPAMLAIIAAKLPTYPESYYSVGIKTRTLIDKRPLPGYKHTFYMQSLKITDPNVDEIIFKSSAGDLIEASTSNLFFVDNDNQLFTANENVYPGITRGIIIRIAEENNIVVVKETVNVTKLADIREAFVTSTTKAVMPIKFLDFKQFEDVGNTTKLLMTKFSEFVQKHS